MTCQIRSDGTCSECKHNSECSDDIFQAVFLLGKISRVTAQPESHGSQLHNGERRHTHTHTHTDRERRNNWHFNTTLQTDTCIDKHKDCPTEGKKASLHTSFAFEDCVI